MTDQDQGQAMLAGLEPPTTPSTAGSMEAAVNAQVEQLRKLQYIEPHHAAMVELALHAARDLDRSVGRGAPSGRANLLRVMNEILESLPQPEAASKDALDGVVALLLAPADELEAMAHADQP